MTDEELKEIIIRGNRRLSLDDCRLIYHLAMEIKPKTIVEIGSMDGVSSMVLGIIAKRANGHLYCIEPNPKVKWKQNIEDLDLITHVSLIKAASPWVDLIMIPLPIDFLFIDGNHKTRWVIVDYHFWFPFLKIGGRIGFHDIHSHVYKEQIWRAINIVMETDKNKLKEIGRTSEASDKGTIIYEKLEE